MTEREHQYTLLLVDDNKTNLLLLVKIIELDLPEVRVLTATSARSGLILAEQEHIDGAFIDVQMPEMSGPEMCRLLNENLLTAGIPMVLMTAHLASPELRAEGLEAGAYDFISQPISNVEMLARIKVMLRLCSSERNVRYDQGDMPQQRSQKQRWIRGLLMANGGADSEIDLQLLDHLCNYLPAPGSAADSEIYECFSEHFPAHWRRTFIQLSLLDEIPLDLGRRFSELRDLEAVLEYLLRYALIEKKVKNGVGYYHFNPSVRNLLRRKATTVLESSQQRLLHLQAADWFFIQQDYVSVFVNLFAAQEYQAVSQHLSRLGLTLLDHSDADKLMVGVAQAPDEMIAKCGWLSLFYGICQLQRLNTEAADWLELSLQLFVVDGDERGQLFALCYQVYLTYIDGNYDRWDKRFEHLTELVNRLVGGLEPSERVRVQAACGYAQLHFDGDIARIEGLIEENLGEAQRLQLVQPQIDISLLRITLELQRGRTLVMRSALEQCFKLASRRSAVGIRAAVVLLTSCESLQAEGDLAGLRRQRKMIDRERGEYSQQVPFTPMLDYYEVTLLLARGIHKAARDVLDIAKLDEAVAFHANMKGQLMQISALCYALEGQREKALHEMAAALQQCDKNGGAFQHIESLLVAAMTCVTLELYPRAMEYLQQGLDSSRRCGEERCRSGLHAWSILACSALGQPVQEHWDALSERLKHQKTDWFLGLTAELLRSLAQLSKKPAPGHLARLLEQNLSLSQASDGELLPLLEVYTLGRFELRMEGQSFDLNQVGHTSRQIFAMLMTSPQRSLSLELLMTQFWPDSPVSKARNSFDSELSRLRKVLEAVFGKQIRKHYLILEKGMLSLRHIRVDSAEFEALAAQARYALQRGYDWHAECLLWRMDHLWQGVYLTGFELADDLHLVRERLQATRIEQVEVLARQLSAQGRCQEAITMLQQGLELEPTRDSLVRQLLKLYRDADDRRTAEKVVERYRETLIQDDYDKFEIEELIDSLNARWL